MPAIAFVSQDIFAVAVSLNTGRIVYISDQAAYILNCKRDVFKNTKFVEFLTPQDVSVFYSFTTPYRLPSWSMCTGAGTPLWTPTPHTSLDGVSLSVLPDVAVKSLQYRKPTGYVINHVWSNVQWMNEWMNAMVLLPSNGYCEWGTLCSCYVRTSKKKVQRRDRVWTRSLCRECVCCHCGVVSSSCPGSGHS